MSKLHLILVSLLLLAFVSAAFGATAYEFDASVEVFDRGEKPRVAVDRFGRFYAVAQDIAATTSTIRYAYSTDFSLTEWNALRNVISAADVYELPDVMVSDDGMVHVAFQYTNSSNVARPQYRNARSFDESFSASTQMASSTSAFDTDASMALPLSVWVDTVNGVTTAYVFTRADGTGTSVPDEDVAVYSAPIYKYGLGSITATQVSTQDGMDKLAAAAKLALGDNALALYATWIYATDIYYDESSNGTTWGTDTLISASAARAVDIDIAVGDDNWDTDTNDDILVVWSDARNGYSQIYADWSRDGGTTWQTDIQVLGTATRYYDQDSPQVTLGQEDGKAHITWRDMRHGTGSIYYIQGIYSATGFQWGIDADEDGVMDSGEIDDALQVDDDEHDAVQKDPCVAVDRYGNVVVAWHDTFTGNIRSAALLYNVD